MQNVFVIYKDASYKTSKPWNADVITPDQPRWNNWSYGFKTKKGLIRHILAVDSKATIVRGADVG